MRGAGPRRQLLCQGEPRAEPPGPRRARGPARGCLNPLRAARRCSAAPPSGPAARGRGQAGCVAGAERVPALPERLLPRGLQSGYSSERCP